MGEIPSPNGIRSSFGNSYTQEYGHTAGALAWKSFVEDDISTSLIVNTPLALSFGSSDYCGISDLSDSTVTCNVMNSVIDILEALTTTPSRASPEAVTAVRCGSFMWNVVSSCNGTYSAICLNCSNPCTDTDAPYTINWAEEAPDMETVQTLFVDYVITVPPPAVYNLTFKNPAKDVLSVTANVSIGEGQLVCSAYRSQLFFEPPSVQYLTVGNTFSGVEDLSPVYTIDNLLPGIQYDVYCGTFSKLGFPSSLSAVLATFTQWTMPCCQELSVDLLLSTFQDNADVTEALAVSTGQFAPLNLTVTITATVGSNTFNMFSPVAKRLTSVSSPSFNVGYKQGVFGSYVLGVELSGPSAASYEVVYPHGQNFKIVFANTETTTPQFVSSTFSSDGTKIRAKFDLPTNQAGYLNSFDCSVLFLISMSTISNTSNHFCSWISNREVDIKLHSGDAAVVGSGVYLKENSLKAMCTSDTNCDSWSYVSNSTVPIAAPVSPVVPRVSVVGPRAIGRFDDFPLDVSGSTGTCGRAWQSFNWTVESESSTVGRVESFLKNNLTISDLYAPIILPQFLFESKMAYSIVLDTCNFLHGCGRNSISFSVSDSGAVPVVKLDGGKLKSIYQHQELVVSGDAYTTTSAGIKEFADLDFTWQLFDDNVLLTSPTFPQYADTSTDSGMFKLKRNTLTVGHFYTLKLTVTHTSSLKYGYAEMNIAVIQGNVVAQITGHQSGSTVGMFVDSSFTIDASTSHDEDLPALNARNMSTVFTCHQIFPTYAEVCNLNMEVFKHALTLSIPSENLDFVNSRYSIRLDVVHELDFRSDFSEIIVEVYPPDAAIIEIESGYPTKLNPTEKLKVVASVMFPVGGTAAWSVDDPAVDLAAVALNPSNSTLFARGATALTTMSLSLVLPRNTLSESSTYQFTLTVFLENGFTTLSSFLLTTNSPPSIGTFEVEPVLGVQVSTMFTFKTFNCEDDDLPLLFEYSFHTITGTTKVLRSRLQKSTFVSALSVGDPSRNNTLLTSVKVYDSLDGVDSAPFYVVVTPSAISDAAVEDALTTSVNNANGGSSGLKNAIALYSTVVNDVDCSAVSSDSAEGITTSEAYCDFHYNRDRCSSVTNTCGKCSEGFTGEEGHSNNLCFSIPGENVPLESGGGLCLSNSDCNAALFEVCQPYGRCETLPKTCTQDCSGSGTCTFVSIYRSALTFPSCNVLETGCISKCACDAGFAGSFCQYTTAEFDSLLSVRSALVSGLDLLISIENPTEDAVTSWVNLISDITNDPEVLSTESRETIVGLCTKILQYAIDLNLSFDGLENIVDIIDLTLPNAYESSGDRRRLNTYEGKAKEMFRGFVSFIESDMLAGQDPTVIIGDSFRLASYSIIGHQEEVLSLPKTIVEEYIGVDTNAVSLPASQNSEQIRVLLSEQNLEVSESDIAFQGAILHVDMDNSLCDKERASTEELSRECAVNVTLQNFDFGSSVDDENFERYTRCFYGYSSSHEYRCPSGVNVTAHCNGTMNGKIVSSCSIHKPASACRSLSSFRSRCEMSGYNTDETYCTCSLPGTMDQQSLEYVSYSTNAIENVESYFIEYDYHKEQDYFMVLISFFVMIALFVGLMKLAERGDLTLWEWRGPTEYANEVERSLPMVMRSKNIMFRFIDEVKFNHRWLGVIASHKDCQPRVFRLFVLWCRSLMVAFLLALIYRHADLVGQNSCEDHLTRDSCTAANAFIGLGSQKCNWRTIPTTEHFDNIFSIDGYCVYVEAENSFGRIFFVALFVALVTVPWSMFVQYLIMKVLASGHGTVNKIVPLTGVLDDLDVAMENNLKAKPAGQDTSFKINRFGRKEKHKHSISYSKADGFGYTNKVIDVDFESQQEYNNVVAQIRAEDNAALIDAWGLDASDGEYLLKKKLKSCRQTALKEKAYFNSSYISNVEKSYRLTYLFVNDFVGTNAISSKILDAKYRKEHFRPYDGISAAVKNLGWTFIVFANLAMFLTVLILSFEMTNLRQNAWVATMVMWLGIDIILLGLGQIVWSDIFIPSLVYDQVNSVKESILKTRASLADTDSIRMPSTSFDMSRYLFVSNRIIQYFPFLTEADNVLNFQSSWPKTFFEKHESIFMPQPYRSVAFDFFLQIIGFLTSLDYYVHDIFIWFFSPVLIVVMGAILGEELYRHLYVRPQVFPGGEEGENLEDNSDVKGVKSYVIPTKFCGDDVIADADAIVKRHSPPKKKFSGLGDMVIEDFDDFSPDGRSESKGAMATAKAREEEECSKTARERQIHAWEQLAPASSFNPTRHPLVNSESSDPAKPAHSVAQVMAAPAEKMKGRADLNPVPRLPEARQECSKLVSKLSRIPSILPEISTDLTAYSHRYSADKPINPNYSEVSEPVLGGTDGILGDREYMDTPTKAKNILRPVLIKSLPSFDMLPAVSRQGPRLVADMVVLTPDKLEKATSVNEEKPELTKDKTFIPMPDFDEFSQELNKSPAKMLEGDNEEEKEKEEEEEDDDSKRWVDDKPDANFDYEVGKKADFKIEMDDSDSDLKTDVEFER
jgi:hypothetical protein